MRRVRYGSTPSLLESDGQLRQSLGRLDETSTETVTEKTERKKDETAFEIERCAHHRAERAGLRRDGDACVSG